MTSTNETNATTDSPLPGYEPDRFLLVPYEQLQSSLSPVCLKLGLFIRQAAGPLGPQAGRAALLWTALSLTITKPSNQALDRSQLRVLWDALCAEAFETFADSQLATQAEINSGSPADQSAELAALMLVALLGGRGL